MPKVNSLVSKYKDDADFMMVYLEEAHASDEWPIYQLEEDIPQHRTLDARLAVAERFRDDFDVAPELTLYVDSIENEFNCAFASWPFRFWVIELGGEEPIVGFKAMPQGATYKIKHLDQYLELCK